jgi:membrane associated rhomboid family serine protease
MIPIRDENPVRRPPLLTYGVIAGCVLVFLWQSSLGERAQQEAVYALGMIPATLSGHAELVPRLAVVPPWMTLLTSMFLHGGLLHLLGNLLYLWIFGNNVEDAMGHLRYAAFYATCGVAAGLTQALGNLASPVPMIGASGAISGVLGAYLMLYPHARVLVWVPFGGLLHLPASLVLGTWFLIQVLASALAGEEEGGVAFGAHVGGFVAGLLLVPIFKRRQVPLLGRRR